MIVVHVGYDVELDMPLEEWDRLPMAQRMRIVDGLAESGSASIQAEEIDS